MIGDFGLSKRMRDANRVDIDPQTNAIILPLGLNDDTLIEALRCGHFSSFSPTLLETKKQSKEERSLKQDGFEGVLEDPIGSTYETFEWRAQCFEDPIGST